MRTFIIAFFLCIGAFAKAQSSELIGHTWKIEKLVINNVETFFPNTTPTVSGVLVFNAYDFSTTVCNTISGRVEYGAGAFNFLSVGGTLNACTDADTSYDSFDSAYIGNFFGTHTQPNGFHTRYTYSIATSGNRTTLAITNPNGDKAIYHREILSTSEAAKPHFSIFPNPANTHVFIRKDTAKKMDITLFDAQGKIVKKENTTRKETRIDISSLVSGVYWLQVDEEGKKYTEKIVKK